MLLTQEHIQILREIGGFAPGKRHHGILPGKHAVLCEDASSPPSKGAYVLGQVEARG